MAPEAKGSIFNLPVQYRHYGNRKAWYYYLILLEDLAPKATSPPKMMTIMMINMMSLEGSVPWAKAIISR